MIWWLFFLFFSLSAYYFHWRNRYFERLGIKSPPAFPLLGHLHEFASIPFGLKIQQWAREYGKTFGIYEGGVPVLITNDPEIVQDVFIKQYENFHARKHFPLAKDPEIDPYASMFTARGLRWKRIRTISNPVFKQSNLKRLCPLVETSCRYFMEIIDEQAVTGKPFNIMENLQLFTSDVIARVALGETKNTQRRETINPYYQLCKEFFPDKPKFASNLLHLLPMVFPEVRGPISHVFHLYSKLKGFDPWYTMERMVQNEVEKRRVDGPNENADFIDLYLESEGTEADLNIGLESTQSDIKQLKIDKKLLTEEIVGQLMLFLIAGYETTANSLSYVVYHLALNQESQEKVRDELIHVTGGAETIAHEMCNQMRYTEHCLKEALRLYPLASFVQARTCMQSTVVGKENKLKVPEGLVVSVDAWTIQRDKSFWGEDADEFRPERFDEVNQSEINNFWVPFGIGPRVCIGMRFSLLEQKILLAKLLLKYRIEPCEQTLIPLKLRGAVTACAESVWVKLVPIN